MENREFVFARFRFDFEHSLLFRDGVPVNLGRRGERILAALLRRRGEVLSKAELLDAAWPGEYVEESNLSVQIAVLRKKLGRSPRDTDWITTVARVGYRFSPAPEPPARRDVPRSDVPLLAILPFTDLSADGGQERFADGIVEDLTTVISRFKSIGVVARNSSFQYRGGAIDIRRVSSELGAHYVLEGSVRRNNGRVRTSFQLIDGRDGSHLWAQNLDLSEGNDLDLQGSISDSVAAAVEPQMVAADIAESRKTRPESLAARDLYLRAKFKLQASRQEDHAAAYALLTVALKQEPENVSILAALCEALHHTTSVGWPALGKDDKKQALELALRGTYLGSNDGAALAMFSNAMFTSCEPDLAAVTMERAINTNPNSSLALVCAGLGNLFLGRTDHAEAYYEAAFKLGPNDPNLRFALTGLASVQRRRGNLEAALELAERSFAVNQSFSSTHFNLIAANALLGRMEEARRRFASYRAIAPTVTIASIKTGQPEINHGPLGPLLEGLFLAGMPES